MADPEKIPQLVLAPDATLTAAQKKELFTPTPGFLVDSFIVSGEKIKDGQIPWDANKKPDFIIEPSQDQMKRMLAQADRLRELYKDDADREEKISTELNRVITTEYGRYDEKHKDRADASEAFLARVEKARKQGEKIDDNEVKKRLAAIGDHRDWDRRNTGDPAKLSEFKRGELVCRHRAAIMSMLLTRADVENYLVTGYTGSAEMAGGDPHAWVVTGKGNVVEACNTPEGTYLKAVNANSVEDIVRGKSYIVSSGKDYYAYGSDFVDHRDLIEKIVGPSRVAVLETINAPNPTEADLKKAAENIGKLPPNDLRDIAPAALAVAGRTGNIPLARAVIAAGPDKDTLAFTTDDSTEACYAAMHNKQYQFLEFIALNNNPCVSNGTHKVLMQACETGVVDVIRAIGATTVNSTAIAYHASYNEAEKGNLKAIQDLLKYPDSMTGITQSQRRVLADNAFNGLNKFTSPEEVAAREEIINLALDALPEEQRARFVAEKGFTYTPADKRKLAVPPAPPAETPPVPKANVTPNTSESPAAARPTPQPPADSAPPSPPAENAAPKELPKPINPADLFKNITLPDLSKLKLPSMSSLLVPSLIPGVPLLAPESVDPAMTKKAELRRDSAAPQDAAPVPPVDTPPSPAVKAPPKAAETETPAAPPPAGETTPPAPSDKPVPAPKPAQADKPAEDQPAGDIAPPPPKKPESGVGNMLLNFGVPLVAAVAAILALGMGPMGLIVAALVAGAATMITQSMTGTGMFSHAPSDPNAVQASPGARPRSNDTQQQAPAQPRPQEKTEEVVREDVVRNEEKARQEAATLRESGDVSLSAHRKTAPLPMEAEARASLANKPQPTASFYRVETDSNKGAQYFTISHPERDEIIAVAKQYPDGTFHVQAKAGVLIKATDDGLSATYSGQPVEFTDSKGESQAMKWGNRRYVNYAGETRDAGLDIREYHVFNKLDVIMEPLEEGKRTGSSTVFVGHPKGNVSVVMTREHEKDAQSPLIVIPRDLAQNGCVEDVSGRTSFFMGADHKNIEITMMKPGEKTETGYSFRVENPKGNGPVRSESFDLVLSGTQNTTLQQQMDQAVAKLNGDGTQVRR